MALYYCNQPNCRGHNNFATACPPAVIPDYVPLLSFQNMQDIQPVDPAKSQPPTPADPASPTEKEHIAFWHE